MSKVDIFNKALSEVGADSLVSEENEQSREASLCRLWYDNARDSVLRAAPWPAATKYARLAMLSERDMDEDWQSSNPDPQFRYKFAAPADLLRPYHLHDFSRFSFTANQISCNEKDPILYYISRQVDISEWSVDLENAVIFRLASHIAKPYTGSNELAQLAMQKALMLTEDAITVAANQQHFQYETLPDFIRERGYAEYPYWQRYYFPFTSKALEHV